MPVKSIPPATSPGRLSRGTRVTIVWAIAAAIALAAAFAPQFAQPAGYHGFADRRSILGIPNFFDVTSNLAFLVVGVMGLHFVLRGTRGDGRRAFLDSSERWGWGVGFAAVVLTCCGSMYYHWAPDNARLAWDRLPLAVGFMSVLAAVVSERISPKAGMLLLAPLVLIGAASVWYWRWSAVRGAENLNPYGAVQFGSVLVILATITLFPPRYTRTGDFVGAAVLYALAKVAEQFDAAIFKATGGIMSGHTMKHLVAAAAVYWLLRMLRLREPV
jgi:hypothetical protein